MARFPSIASTLAAAVVSAAAFMAIACPASAGAPC